MQPHNFKNNKDNHHKEEKPTGSAEDTQKNENLTKSAAPESLTQKIEKQLNPQSEPLFKKEAEEFKDKYLRALAELENNKKYSNKLLEETSIYAINKFAKELLVVMDIFDKALATIDVNQIKEENFKTFAEGIILTKQELLKIFSKFNIKALDNTIKGQTFDPNFHEALMSKAVPEKENNTIFEVFEPGYLIKEKLLRPAKVGIVKNS